MLLGPIPETAIKAAPTSVATRRMPAAVDPGTALTEGDDVCWTSPMPRLGWTDAIRAIELDDAVRRSLHHRRAYQMDLQEASEEANFKGTMTLVGCSILWLIIALLFASIWVPYIGYVIFPALGVFLVLQLFRWAIPRSGGPGGSGKT